MKNAAEKFCKNYTEKFLLISKVKGKENKGKVHTRTGHNGPEGPQR
jgi:hypothetical protein